MSQNDNLFMAVRQAVNDSETAASNPDDLLSLQAWAAVEAVQRSGWVEQAGWEYAARVGDVTLSCGFHTFEGARDDAIENHPDKPWVVERRPIGLWGQVPETSPTDSD